MSGADSRSEEEETWPVAARRRHFSRAAVISVAAIFGLTYSLTASLIALDLLDRGFGETLIGANAAMHALGVLIAAPLLPGLAVRFGPRPLIIAALVSSAVILVLFPVVPSVWLWFPLRLALGAASDFLFVLSETWTNELTEDQARGRVMAIYTASLSVGFAAGPLILSVVGVGTAGYLIGAAIAALAIVPVANRFVMAPAHMEPATARPYQYFGMAPVAIAATMLNAGVELAGLSFLAIYAAGLGWSEQQGVQLVSALMVGAIMLQLPIGWLADRMDRRRLILLLSVLSALGALTWPYMLAEPWIAYAAVFVWGGLFVGIYTVMIAEVGSRFSGGDLVGIYAVMGFGWGGGALIGPVAAGPAMDASPSYGLPLVIALGCAAFAVFVLLRRGRA